MTKALILIGSPRGKRSTSTSLGMTLMNKLTEKGMDTQVLWINRQVVTPARKIEMIAAVDWADIVVLTAPLYDDCQPSIVTETMEALAGRPERFEEKKRFFPIINCGFPEPEQITAVSISIYRKFASMVGLKWAGSLAIGGGEVLQGATGKSLERLGKMGDKVARKLDEIARALASESNFSDEVMRILPNFFYKSIVMSLFVRLNNFMWKTNVKKNGGKVDHRPYAP